jgi:hypothetical protein
MQSYLEFNSPGDKTMSIDFINNDVITYWENWKRSASFKSINKEDRKKFDEVIKFLSDYNKKNIDLPVSVIAEQYLYLASNIVHVKWQKKDPKSRVDINIKCDSFFNKVKVSFQELRFKFEKNKKDIAYGLENISKEEEIHKILVCSKILDQYAIALNSGGELED